MLALQAIALGARRYPLDSGPAGRQPVAVTWGVQLD